MKAAIHLALLIGVGLAIAFPLHVSAQRIPLFQIASETTSEIQARLLVTGARPPSFSEVRATNIWSCMPMGKPRIGS